MALNRKFKKTLRFCRPARFWGARWREGLPAGNGVIGASVLGGAGDEVIMLTHTDLWWQGHVGVLPDVAEKCEETRRLMDEGKFKEADKVIPDALIGKGYRPVPSVPLPLCDFCVKMKVNNVKEYVRSIALDSGEATVSFKDGAVRYDRSLFVSRAQNIVVYEITKAGPRNIDASFSLRLHDKINARTPTTPSKLPDGVRSKVENYFMYFSARSDNGTEYGAVARVNFFGGSQTVTEEGISITGAEKIIVLVKTFIESQREKEWKEGRTALAAIKSTYEKLFKEHASQHAKLMNTAELDFAATDKDQEAYIEDLIADTYKTGEISPVLLEKLWLYGRYLMISGASENSLLYPYGLWCGDYKAVDAQTNAAGNLQNLYFPVFEGNLAEFALGVFTHYESVMDDLKKNASRLYNCRGIMIPAITARGTGLIGSLDSHVVHFTAAAGLIAAMYYDYYLFTGDLKFLKNRALPFMKEAATFYENFFKLRDDSFYVDYPAHVPGTDSGTEGEVNISRNSLLDFAVAKQLLQNLIEGSETVGVNKSDISKWKEMLTHIPGYKLAPDGTVRENMDNKFTGVVSRSTALFYPVFPGCEYTDTRADLFKAFEKTAARKLEATGDRHDAASLASYAAIFGRTGNHVAQTELIATLIKYMAMNNLIFAANDFSGMGITIGDEWATYGIGCNEQLSGVIQEMLVQSDKNTIKLLPSLPENLCKGELSGFLTRTGVSVDLSWDVKKSLISGKLKAKRARRIWLETPLGIKRFKANGSEKLDAETGGVSLELPANKLVSFEIKL